MEKGRFAFGAAREGYTQIYTMDEDGSNVRQLTSGEGRACSSPSLSPDGRSIVFLSNRAPADEENHDEGIFVMNCDGTGRTRLTQDLPEYGFGDPRFSSDGKRLVFTEDYAKRCVIGVMNVDGNERRQVLEVPQWTSPVFTMDGQSILYDCEGELYRVGVDGGEPSLLFRRKQNHIFLKPEVHPDGERIAFLECWRQPSEDFCYPPPRSQYRLVEARLEGWGFTPLTQFIKWPMGHTFSPDGARLAFLGCRLEKKHPKGSRLKAKKDYRSKRLGTRLFIIKAGEWESAPLRSIPDGLGMMSLSWGPMVDYGMA